MLQITITNTWQTSQYTHEVGPLVLGREPNPDPGHVVIDDEYVSRRQLLMEQVASSRVRLENVGRNPLEFPGGKELRQGEREEVELPTQLRVGRTVVEVAAAAASANATAHAALEASQLDYRTTSLPVQRPGGALLGRALSSLGQIPAPETLAHWFETLLSVQRSAVGSTAFYEETARALVDLVGLDRGFVLLRTGPGWKVAAVYAQDQRTDVQYSRSLLERAVQEGRTVYGNPQAMSIRISLANLEAVVASPILNAQGQIVGALYGSRNGLAAARAGVSSLEAQVVQLLASSVSAGLIRLEMQERLKQVEQLAAVGQAIAYIMHDLRGPLGNLRQLLEMLCGGRRAVLSRAEQLELMEESLAVSTALLDDSLEFCRGNVHVEPVSGPFCVLLDKHLRLLRVELAAARVALDLDIAEDLRVRLDPDRMARVLRNLAKNAGEALRGRADAVVTIGARKTSEGLEIYVADNGPGLPPEIRDQLFQPFSTQGKRGGTGFGLAIAKQLVEAHAGQITVATSASGTRFTILLPLGAAEAGAAVPRGSRGAASPDSTASDSYAATPVAARVLLVDDTLVNQRLIAGLLRVAGHQVSVVGSGPEAVDAWQAQPFDVVLMDIELPGMDGLEATRIIRERERQRGGHTPIVALTAHEAAERQAACRAAGMDAILRKPICGDDLCQLVRDLAAQGKPGAGN